MEGSSSSFFPYTQRATMFRISLSERSQFPAEAKRQFQFHLSFPFFQWQHFLFFRLGRSFLPRVECPTAPEPEPASKRQVVCVVFKKERKKEIGQQTNIPLHVDI